MAVDPDDIRRAILRHLPPGTPLDRLQSGWPLGPEGAGLDAIAIVELLIDCEQRFDVRISEALLSRGRVDVAAVVQAVLDQRETGDP